MCRSMLLSFAMTVTYGAGAQFAAQCPHAAVPQGWRYWREETDGPIPAAVAARAQALSNDTSIPLGATESYPLPGTTALILVEPHPWTRDDKGAIVTGCFHGAGVYVPSGEPVTPPLVEEAGMSKTVGILTVASLSVGLLLSVPALFRGRR
jgi:hypothetical protein